MRRATLSDEQLRIMWSGLRDGRPLLDICEDMGITQIVDPEQIRPAVRGALNEHPEAVTAYRDGNIKALNSLVGSVLRRAGCERFEPQIVEKMFREAMEGPK